MIRLSEKHTNSRNYILFASVFLNLLLGLPLIALAKYVPPKQPSAPKDTVPRATRGGCSADSRGELIALAPLSHVGQTSSKYPTFVWYVPDQERYLLQFRLFDSDGQRLYQTELQSQPGFMQVSLPQNQPALKLGPQYRWQVVLVCDPNSPSQNLAVEAEIKTVELPSGLKKQLVTIQNSEQRSNLYAENGFWYDALSETIKGVRDREQLSLLELLNSLATSEANNSRDWSDRLKQTVELERQRNRTTS